jgi:nucleotide-binding universal stress UspA family protein
VPEGRRRARFEKILIGWNASPEAVRAITGAAPLLQAASKVVIATVDATPSPGGHAPRPGQELAAYLARHGVTAEVRNIDGLGRTHAEALQETAIDVDADLMVIGAYGHSRAREIVFGGVTRELLANGQLPLLMAH